MKENFEAVIFDVDGLMFDTERIWVESVMKTNKDYGTNLTKDFLVTCMGLKKDLITEKFREVLPKNISAEEFRTHNKKYFYEEIDTNGPCPKKGLFELLGYLKEHNIKTAIASSSYREKVLKYLEKAKVDKSYFNAIICGDMVKNSKPEPDIYLKACEVLNVNPSNSLALEDSANGLLSAYRAGTKPIFIKDLKEHDKSILDLVYKRFDDLSQVITLFE